MGFLFESANMPFTVALCMMMGIALLEGVTTLLGMGASDLIQSILPDFDIDADIDIDVDADVDADLGGVGSSSFLFNAMGWLHIGRVPILVLVVLFLFSFGLAGLCVQSAIHSIAGVALPGFLASIPALIAAVFFVRIGGGLVAKVIPQDETEAVKEKSFIGRVGTITLGKAQYGKPAQAKLKDSYGQTHYVMVQPDSEDVIFQAGDLVLIVSGDSGSFFAIPNPSDALVD